MNQEVMIEAARALADRLQGSLDDVGAEQVILARDEAVLAKGLIDGLVELLENEAGNTAG